MLDLCIHQKPVHFKLEVSKKDSPITSFAGLALVRETLKRLGLIAEMKTFCLKQAGYADEIVIEALVLLLASGGRSFSDWEYLCKEEGFVRFFNPCPSVDTLERYLRRLKLEVPERKKEKQYSGPESIKKQKSKKKNFGDKKVENAEIEENSGQVGYSFTLEKLQSLLIQKAYALAGSPKVLTADIDSTITHSHNQEALWAYDNEKGYQPMMVFCPELGLILAHEFRDGNVSAKEGYDRLFARCQQMFPKVKWKLRSDSAAYQLEWLDEISVSSIYYITARRCDNMLSMAKNEKSWKSLIKDGVITEQEYCELSYVASFSSQEQLKKRRTQKFIGIRKKRKQVDLIEGEYSYQVIVTNDTSPDLNKIIQIHRARCGSIEFANAEIKNGCGMNHIPSNEFKVNAAWFSLGVLTHNLLKLIQTHLLPEKMRKVEIKTLRFRLMRLAALVIKKAKQTILRFSRDHPAYNIYHYAWNNLQILTQ